LWTKLQESLLPPPPLDIDRATPLGSYLASKQASKTTQTTLPPSSSSALCNSLMQARHSGQLDRVRSHSSTHSGWNVCSHLGSIFTFSPSVNMQRQIEHIDSSPSLSGAESTARLCIKTGKLLMTLGLRPSGLSWRSTPLGPAGCVPAAVDPMLHRPGQRQAHLMYKHKRVKKRSMANTIRSRRRLRPWRWKFLSSRSG